MTNRPKAIGTAAETAVARALRTLGFPHAERRALTGALDQGDITGTPGIAWEVKGGEAAKSASDGQVQLWLAETFAETHNAEANVGVLVLQRRGVGAANAGRWWAVLSASDLFRIHGGSQVWGLLGLVYTADMPVRMLLADVTTLLRAGGYGDPLTSAALEPA